MRIAVFGSGYVGTVTAAGLAARGHTSSRTTVSWDLKTPCWSPGWPWTTSTGIAGTGSPDHSSAAGDRWSVGPTPLDTPSPQEPHVPRRLPRRRDRQRGSDVSRIAGPSRQPVQRRLASRSPCTAVVVTYQSVRHIGTLLQGLQAEREAGLDLDVLVIDQASTDGTAEVVAGFEWVRLVQAGGNFGYAAGVNVGGKLTPPGRPLLVLNPDLVLAPGALGRLLEALDDPAVGVVVPRIDEADGALCLSLRHEPSIGRALMDAVLGRRAAWLPRGWSGLVWDPQAYETEQYPDWATGAVLLVSGASRAVVGEWDERYFLYSEEIDYLRRVRASGLRIRYLPDAVVRHVRGGSGTSDGLYALCSVNYVRYYRGYHSFPSTLTFGAMIALNELLRIRRSASRLALRALLSPAVRSTLPGPTPSSAARGDARG